MLGLNEHDPLPVYAAPAIETIDLDQAAVLRVATARVDEASATIHLARASRYPSTAIGVRWENERHTGGDETMVGLAWTTELPFRRGRTARANVRAAEAERAAAREETKTLRAQIAASLSRVARTAKIAELARAASAETRQRIDAAWETWRSSAAVGFGPETERTPVFEAVALLAQATDAERQSLRAETTARVAQAELWRFASVAQLTSSFSPP
jgi:outer membrane protein TolC